MSSILRSLVVAVVGLAGCFLQASESPFSIATVGNAYAFVRGDGTFVVRGIPAFAAWQSNHDGTVSPSEPIRYLVRIATPLGRGASVDRFTIPLQFTGDPAVVDAPPIVFDSPPENIRLRLLATVSATELAYGETARMTVIKVAGNNARSDITSDPATIYTSSNPLVASVSRAGVIEAGKRWFPSVAVITAMHDGLAATATVRVVAAAVDSDGDGIADEWETVFGFNPYDPGDAGLDPDGDGLANLREYELETNPVEQDTDRDGFNDRVDDDPLVPEYRPPTIVVSEPFSGQSFHSDDIVHLRATALDNALVVRMQLLINGIDMGVSLSDAIQRDFRMGDYSSEYQITVEIRAWDIAGNMSFQVIALALEPDPAPNPVFVVRVSGRVIAKGQPVSGAWIHALDDGSMVRSGSDGRFVIVRRVIKAQEIDSTYEAWSDIDGQRVNQISDFRYQTFSYQYSGNGEWEKDIGDIDLDPGPIVSSDMGELTEDGQVVDLPAPVLFYGKPYRRIVVRAGQVSFGADSNYGGDSQMRAGPPVAIALGSMTGDISVSPSLVPGSSPLGQYVRANQNGVAVTWLNIRRATPLGLVAFSAQLTLAVDGTIDMVYDLGSGVFLSLVGLYPGDSIGIPQMLDVGGHEDGSSSSNGENPIRYVSLNDYLNLSGRHITFTPTQSGGYAVRWSSSWDATTKPALFGRFLIGDRPLANASVQLSTGQMTATDATGRFEFLPLVERQPPIFVAGDALPGGTGRSWATAYRSLDDALSTAGRDSEIWVKTGSYELSRPHDLYEVSVLGGFAGTESSSGQRKEHVNPTRVWGAEMSLWSAYLDHLSFDAADAVQGSTYVTMYNQNNVVRNCIFANHRAYGAAAVVKVEEGARAVFDRCVFADNRGDGLDAAGLTNAGMAILNNCLLTGNKAQGPVPVIWSGSDSTLALNHCTMARNQTRGSPCVVVEGRLIVQNSVINNEFGDGISQAVDRVAIYDSIIGNWSGQTYGSVVPGSLPTFADSDHPQGADGVWGTADDGLALVSGSAGVDAITGLSQIIDLAGRGRPTGGGADIGAYETQGVPLSVPKWPFIPMRFRRSRLQREANLTLTVTDPDTGEIYTIPNIGILPHRSSDTGDITVGQPIPGGIGLRIPTADPSRTLTLQLAARGRP